ncbi:MAG: glycosyltransferase [Methanobacteriaceae archaeon]|nr:glycosyltransferase [Methanobacteriaceae archaeon]MDO9627239.1 glycosyltransferase [Methanobacteriaceae archaeon]
MEDKTAQKIGNYWSEMNLKDGPKKIRWWEFPLIHKHLNNLICGEPVDGINQCLKKRLEKMGTLKHGVSVGFGDGNKELELVSEGLVDKFTMFELSDAGIAIALKKAENLGIEDKVELIKGNYFLHEFNEKVDFVHWSQSLHHMFDVNKSVEWSYKILEMGGIFYMDDFVGPSRFQWSDEALELGSRIRRILPDNYLKNPYKPGKLLNRKMLRPDPQILRNQDPSEAADSDNILESVIKYFPDAEITLTGGTIYHETLNDILHNIDEFDLKDKAMLELLLIIDELATKSGIESQYATALGMKSPNSVLDSKIGKINENQLNYTETRLKQANSKLKYTENKLKIIEEKYNYSNQIKQERNQIISNILNENEKFLNENEKLVSSLENKNRQFDQVNSHLNKLTSSIYELNYFNSNRPLIERIISKAPSLFILAKNKGQIKNAVTEIKGYKSIKKNNLFDLGYYLRTNRHVMISGKDPLLHYIYHGFKENLRPNPNFDGDFYLEYNESAKLSNLNPLIHYSLYGIPEGLEINGDNIDNVNKNPEIIIETENCGKYDEIINKNASLINLQDFEDSSPLVSIIVITHNGLEHLQRLFNNFAENIQYPSYEIIIVDNSSTDDTINFLESLDNLPLKIIKNEENKSFSEANNDAVKKAHGEFILLLNNDIEPTYGWLNEMMQTAFKYNNLGCLGAKLVYPDSSFSVYNKDQSFTIQHIGISFKEESNGFIKPYNMGKGLEPFEPECNIEQKRAGVTAAVLLVKKEVYEEVGGLDEGYKYGYEDVDFCLKLLKNGYDNIYCPSALLFHYEHGTDGKKQLESILNRHISNKNLLNYKWNDWLSNKIIIDKLNNENLISEDPLNISFMIGERHPSAGDFTELIINEALKKSGWDVSFVSSEDYKSLYHIKNYVDIVVSTLHNYYPLEIHGSKKKLIKIALILDSYEEWMNNPVFNEYDLAITNSKTTCEYLKRETNVKARLIPVITGDIIYENIKMITK